MSNPSRLMMFILLTNLLLTSCGTPAVSPATLPPESSSLTPLPTLTMETDAIVPESTQTPDQISQPITDSCLVFTSGQFAEAQGPIIPLNSKFTVEVWVYDLGDSGGFVEYISQGQQPGPFYLGTTQGSDVIRAGDAWGDTGYVMPKKSWTHIALTRTSGGAAKLYINGELVANTSEYSFGSGGSPFRLGRQFGNIGEYFTGCMDEVKVFGSVRSAEQILSDMLKTDEAVSDPDLIAYYNFNDTSDPSIIRQANGSAEHELQLGHGGEWLPADQAGLGSAAFSVTYSSSIGLSNCEDGTCGAYIVSPLSNVSPNYEMGFSWYSTVWPMLTEPPGSTFQMGLGSTWLTPDLRNLAGQAAFNLAIQQVCNGFGSERGDYQWVLFQSVEGGLGYWTDTQFKSAMPKWRFNATSDCYQSPMHGTPGWPTGKTKAFAIDKPALVQLSNRMLLAPDGQTFPLTTNNELLGVAWIPLPFPQVGPQNTTSPTGPNAWTLFMNSANFKGPLAYWMPQYFSDKSQIIPGLAGLGLDAKPGYIGEMASEIGWMPLAVANDEDGHTYTRIPQLRFPVDEKGRSILSQDVVGYSEQGPAADFIQWLNGGTDTFGPFGTEASRKLNLRVNGQPNYYQQKDVVGGLANQVRIASFDSGASYGFQWRDTNSSGYFPAYFRDDGNVRTIIPEDQVPPETFLTTFDFSQSSKSKTTYKSPSWWEVDSLGIPGGTVTLSDGSTVTYVWFKFVDQPALRHLRLNEADRETLQAMVERMQRTMPIDGEYMAPPSSGTLVSFDPALLVTPPPGYEYGYVPIVIEQTGSVIGPPLP